MIKEKLRKGEDVNKALTRFKKKVIKAGIIREVRKRQEFVKPSLLKRNQKLKAKYVQKLRTEDEK